MDTAADSADAVIDASRPVISHHNQQISPFSHDYTLAVGAVNEPPTPPHRPSSVRDSCSSTGDIHSTSHSFANPARQRAIFSSNMGGLPYVQPEQGLAGVTEFPTPGSQSQLADLDSLHDTGQDQIQTINNTNTQIPAWFADEDFDLSAFNSEILMSAGSWLQPDPGPQHPSDITSDSNQLLANDISSSRESMVQLNWYTYMGMSRSDHATPEIGTEKTQVDEAYRASLAVKLQPHIPFLPLPSTEFLVCLPLTI